MRIFETEDLSAPPGAPKAERFAWWAESAAARNRRRLTFLKAGDGWRWFGEGALVFPGPGRDGAFTFGGKTLKIFGAADVPGE